MREQSESGAVAVMAAMLLVVLLLASAFVIDLGALRADYATGKSASDMAATAAAFEYDFRAAGAAEKACLEAIRYAEDNLRDVDSSSAEPGSSCVELGTWVDDRCPEDDEAFDAIYTAGNYTITVTMPVPDGHPLLGTQADVGEYEAKSDGEGCGRVGVRVERSRDYRLAPIAGFIEGETRPSSVARAFFGDDGEYVSLIVLDRESCEALRQGGSGDIRVLDLELTDEDGDTEAHPGRITVDAIRDCNNDNVIQQDGNSGFIEATGGILSYALKQSAGSNDGIYNTGGDFRPAHPVPGPKITRSPIDHRYNCWREPDGGYPSSPNWSPSIADQDIDPCASEDDDDGKWIFKLEEALGPVDASTTGWAVYPDDAEDANCDAGSINGDAELDNEDADPTRWYIDCPNFRPDEFYAANVDFIVFPEGIDLNNADFFVNDSGPDDANGHPRSGTVVYVQNGGVEWRGSDLRLRDTFLYMDDTNGAFEMGGSSGRYSHLAPLDRADAAMCDGSTGSPPVAGCFAPLAMWSNHHELGQSNKGHTVRGNGSGGIVGTVFTPNSYFRVRGGGGELADSCSATEGVNPSWSSIDSNTGSMQFESAQFFAGKLNVGGGGNIHMCPSPGSSVSVPLSGSGLIR